MSRDGKPDVFAITSDSMSVLLGQGDGTLVAKWNVPAASDPAVAVIADMNGDGRMDVALAFLTEYQRTAGVLLGNGDGTFASRHLDWPAEQHPSAMATADLNGDGKVDIVMAHAPDGVAVLLGTADGTFAPKADYAIGTSSHMGSLTSIDLADLNGDGKLDIATASHDWSASATPATVTVLLGNGDGGFATGVPITTGFEPCSLKLGDLNGDGKPDIVMTNHEDGMVSVRLGKGDGTFAAAADYPAGISPTELALGDLNRDGKLDIVVLTEGAADASAAYGVIYAAVLLGNGDGTFAVRQDSAVVDALASLALADLDGDGNLDIVVVSGNIIDGSVGVSLGNGDGTFGGKVDFHAGGSYARMGALGDFNHDGNLDVMTLNRTDPGSYSIGSISVLLGNGDGTLAANSDYPVNDLTLAAADVSGDGSLDLIGVSSSGAVDVLLGACR